MTVQTTEIPARPVPRLAKELVKSSGFLLAKLGMGFKAKALAKLEEAGFDPYHYSVLAILGEGARETQAMIADSLEERGLIARQRDPHDRRRHVVSITPAGKRQLQRLRSIAKELEDEFFAPLAAEDRQAFHELLLQLACAHDPRCGFAPTVSSKPD